MSNIYLPKLMIDLAPRELGMKATGDDITDYLRDPNSGFVAPSVQPKDSPPVSNPPAADLTSDTEPLLADQFMLAAKQARGTPSEAPAVRPASFGRTHTMTIQNGPDISQHKYELDSGGKSNYIGENDSLSVYVPYKDRTVVHYDPGQNHWMRVYNGREITDTEFVPGLNDKPLEPFSDNSRIAWRQSVDEAKRSYPNASLEKQMEYGFKLFAAHMASLHDSSKDKAAHERELLRLQKASDLDVSKAEAMAKLADSKSEDAFVRDYVVNAIRHNPNEDVNDLANQARIAFRAAGNSKKESDRNFSIPPYSGGGNIPVSAGGGGGDLQIPKPPVLSPDQIKQLIGNKNVEQAVSSMAGSSAMKNPKNIENILKSIETTGLGGKNLEALDQDFKRMLIQSAINLNPDLKQKMMNANFDQEFELSPGVKAKINSKYQPYNQDSIIGALSSTSRIPFAGTDIVNPLTIMNAPVPNALDVTLPNGAPISIPGKFLQNATPAYLNDEQRALESQRGELLRYLMQGMYKR